MTKQLTDTITFRHGAQVQNRLVQPAMLTNSGQNDGFISQDTLDYYSARSRSAGMILVEYCYVSQNGGPALTKSLHRQQLGIHTDAHTEGLAQVAQVLQKDGHKALCQLAHTGREAAYRIQLGEDVVAPSAIDYDFLDYPVRALTGQEVEAIIEDFGQATRRAIEAGFDGVEIHGANHYLIQQFFSQTSNHREDQWGGSLANRARFAIEVTRSVFEAARKYGAPDDFIIGYRISPEEIHGDQVGYDYQESNHLIQALIDQFDLDYIHLSLPHYQAGPSGLDQSYAELVQNFLPDEVKLVIVGQVFDEETAKAALAHTDLVATGRATIIDPEFGHKIDQGLGHEIVTAISPQQLSRAHWTPGLVHLFTQPQGAPYLKGQETISDLYDQYPLI
ncbi:oxidoreductase [Hutsoniella sourekii]